MKKEAKRRSLEESKRRERRPYEMKSANLNLVGIEVEVNFACLFVRLHGFLMLHALIVLFFGLFIIFLFFYFNMHTY